MVKSAHKILGIMVVFIVILTFSMDALSLSLIRGINDESFSVLEGEFSVTKGYLTHLFARDSGHAILKIGAKIDRLVATGQSEVDITEAAEANYVEADDKSIIRISNGVIGYLIMKGNSQAQVKKMVINASLYPIPNGMLKDGGIILGVGSVIHVWADNVTFEDARIRGKWSDGKDFSILLVEHKIENGEDKYEIARSLPQQIQIHKTDAIDVRKQ